ncbi:Fimbrial protein precursor, partial [Haemophilus influenzae]
QIFAEVSHNDELCFTSYSACNRSKWRDLYDLARFMGTQSAATILALAVFCFAT